MTLRATALTAIDITVADLDRTAAFYGALGFETVARRLVDDPAWHHLRGTTGRAAEILDMRLGAQAVAFVRYDPPGRPYPPDSTSTDLWFQHLAIVVGDMDAAFAILRSLDATPISRAGPERLPPSTGGVRAVKFRDPDGHPLELLWFPPDVGDGRWHGPGTALFRGIDHSAIAVADAAASQRFYADMLGLSVGTATVNHGPEQVRLDDVADDVVDVVPMAPRTPTPHIELLGYRTGPRRPIPAATRPADIAVTWMTLQVDDPDDLPLGKGHRRATLADGRAAIAIADPDGHRLMLVDRTAPI